MSQHAAASPPSRPPSSASSTASGSSTTATRHHHDHSRPLPPPRLPSAFESPASLPPSPRLLSSSTSFRSAGRPAPVGPPPPATPSPSLPRPGGAVPVTTTTTTTAAAAAAAAALAEVVSLEVPRPDGERIPNEYVETPFRPAAVVSKPGALDAHQIKPSNHQRSSCPLSSHKTTATNKPSRRPIGSSSSSSSSSSSRSQQQQRRRQQLVDEADAVRPVGGTVITKQPVSFTKEPSNGLGGPRGTEGTQPSLSIMCDQCGRCRCESCREPPPLPSRWVCDNSCLCSPESVIDYASCVCCVKGVFYHCAEGGVGGGGGGGGGPGAGLHLDTSELGSNCADEPCSCGGSRKTARWTFMGAMALVLPCLLCYWPLRGCLYVCEACYAKHASQGCRCEPRSLATARQAGLASDPLNSSTSSSTSSSQSRSQLSEALIRDSRDPEKRLLDPLGAEL